MLMAVALMITATESFAQNPKQTTEKQPQKQQQKQLYKGKFSKEKIKNLKIAFFTDKLSLTSEEAEKFWPVYKACEKEAYEARKETMKAQRALSEAVKEKSGKSDKDIRQLVDNYYAAIDNENVVAKNNFAKYSKVLPVNKAAMVRVLEEQFLHSLIGQMKGGGVANPHPKPQPFPKHTETQE